MPQNAHMPNRPAIHRPAARPRTPPRRERGTTSERGYDHDWQRLRAAYIAEHPLCEECERKGSTVVADDVDHKRAFQGREDPLRLDWNNLRALCRTCHNQKTKGRGGLNL